MIADAAAAALPAKHHQNACLEMWHQMLHLTMLLTQRCPTSCCDLAQRVLCGLVVHVTPTLDVRVGSELEHCCCSTPVAAPAVADLAESAAAVAAAQREVEQQQAERAGSEVRAAAKERQQTGWCYAEGGG